MHGYYYNSSYSQNSTSQCFSFQRNFIDNRISSSFCRFDLMPKTEQSSGASSPESKTTGPGQSSSSICSSSSRGPYTCAICEDNADGFHFGAIACAACGAFFRRSIADGKTYTCTMKGCPVRFDSAKRGGICRFCRFEKGLAVGMLPPAKRQRRCDESVHVHHHPYASRSQRASLPAATSPSSSNHLCAPASVPQFSCGTPRPGPIRHQSGSFDSCPYIARGVLDLIVIMRRDLATSRQLIFPTKYNNVTQLRIFPVSRFVDECRLMAEEFLFFRRHVLSRTPFLYMIEDDPVSKALLPHLVINTPEDERRNSIAWHDLEKGSMIRELFLAYYVFESALATVKDAGIQLDRKVLTDASIVELRNLQAFFTDDNHQWDAACIANLATPCFTHHVHTLARSLQSTHLDEVETAALFTVFCVHAIPYGTKSVSAERVRQLVLEELHNHYSGSHGDTASKFGAVVLQTTQLTEALYLTKEFIETVDLMCPNPWIV